jgi:hypothetical protein
MVDSFAVIQPGIYFFGRAAAQHAKFYADWCNEHPVESSDTEALAGLTIFTEDEAASA